MAFQYLFIRGWKQLSAYKWFAFKLMKTMYEILNKQVKFLTSQYVGTSKSSIQRAMP